MAADKQMTMLLWIFASSLLTLAGAQQPRPQAPCLTGRMTDVQSWVDESGKLTASVDFNMAMDLSSMPNPSSELMGLRRPLYAVKYLSLARCRLIRVPAVFDTFEDYQGRKVSQTLEYLSLFGNKFLEINVPGKQYDVELRAEDAKEVNIGVIGPGSVRAIWSSGFQRVQFEKLKELDLRSCGIGNLDAKIFENMPKLEALYLGNNAICTIATNAFAGLTNLLHLDLSNNFAMDMTGNAKSIKIESKDIFSPLENLKSLDFSNTKLNGQFHGAFRYFGKSLERVSLCHTGLFNLESRFFMKTSLKVLDITGNHGILMRMKSLEGLEGTLKVLYANEIGLTRFEIFKGYTELEILEVAANEIGNIPESVARSLKKLQVLDLRVNRFTAWFSPIFSHMTSLKYLDLRNNMINVLSREMVDDFTNISYVGVINNPVVCNCQAREFIETATRNEIRLTPNPINPLTIPRRIDTRFLFHRGFLTVNAVISSRHNISRLCSIVKCHRREAVADGNFLVFDYDQKGYSCLKVGSDGTKIPFEKVNTCREADMYRDMESKFKKGKTQLLFLLVIPCVLLPCLILAFIFRRNLKYFFVIMRNSALLSMVNKNKVITDDTNFTYDVFVSYCNDDRAWVLDQLLTHLETDCRVSLCLHERDFQVGLSILENIVSCMDRSKAIMLVISQQFLLSQWCQFELHLAQHRLLETRREDLILILLEDIPRRLRPNTLHYLMLTKTYIVWPKKKSEQHLFWKRLKKSVVTQKQKPENVTLA